MKKLLLLSLLLAALPVCAQDEMPKAQEAAKAPELKFRVVQDFFKIPSDMIMAEAVGVTINSKGHIFILNRGNHPILEFDQEGNFIGSFGEGSPLFRVPHSIRFDAHDNLWYVAAGDNLVVKFDPKRKSRASPGPARRGHGMGVYDARNRARYSGTFELLPAHGHSGRS